MLVFVFFSKVDQMNTVELYKYFSKGNDALLAISEVMKTLGCTLHQLDEEVTQLSGSQKEIFRNLSKADKKKIKIFFFVMEKVLKNLVKAEPPCPICKELPPFCLNPNPKQKCFRDHPLVNSSVFWICQAYKCPRKWLIIAKMAQTKEKTSWFVSWFLDPFVSLKRDLQKKQETKETKNAYQQLLSGSIPLKKWIPHDLVFWKMEEAQLLCPVDQGMEGSTYVIVVAQLHGLRKQVRLWGQTGFQSDKVEVVNLVHYPWTFTPLQQGTERIVTLCCQSPISP